MWFLIAGRDTESAFVDRSSKLQDLCDELFLALPGAKSIESCDDELVSDVLDEITTDDQFCEFVFTFYNTVKSSA